MSSSGRLDRVAQLVPGAVAVGMGACTLPWFIGGQGPSGGDWPMHASDAVATADALRAFDFDLWLDNAGLGHPAGLTHPLFAALALAGPVALGLEPWLALSLFAAVVVVLRPFAIWWGLRVLGAPPPHSAAAVLVCAALSSTSPWGQTTTSLCAGGLHAQALAATIIPVAIGLLVRAVLDPSVRTDGSKRRRWDLIIAATAAGLAVNAHPIAALWLATVGLGIVFAIASSRSARMTKLRRLVVVSAGTTAVAAPTLVPLMVFGGSWGGVAFRAGGDGGEAAIWSLLSEGLLTDYGRPPLISLLAVVVVIANVALRMRRAPSQDDTRRAPGIVLGAAFVAVVAGVVVALAGAAGPERAAVPWGRALVMVELGVGVVVGVGSVEVLSAVWRRASSGGARAHAAAAVATAIVVVVMVTAFATQLQLFSALVLREAPVSPQLITEQREALRAMRATHDRGGVDDDTSPRVAAIDAAAVSALELSAPYVAERIPALFVQGGPSFHGAPLRRHLTSYEPSLARLLQVGSTISVAADGQRRVESAPGGPRCEGVWLVASSDALATSRGDVLQLRTHRERSKDAVPAVVRRVRQRGGSIDVNVDGADGAIAFVCKVGFHPRFVASASGGSTARTMSVGPGLLGVLVDVSSTRQPSPIDVHLRFVRPWWTWGLWLGLMGWCAGAAAIRRRLDRGHRPGAESPAP